MEGPSVPDLLPSDPAVSDPANAAPAADSSNAAPTITIAGEAVVSSAPADGIAPAVTTVPGEAHDGPAMTDEEAEAAEKKLEEEILSGQKTAELEGEGRLSPPADGEAPITPDQAAAMMAKAEGAAPAAEPVLQTSLPADVLDLEEALLRSPECPRCAALYEPCSAKCFGELPPGVTFDHVLGEWRRMRDAMAVARGGALFGVLHGSVHVDSSCHLRGPRVGDASGVGAVVRVPPEQASEWARKGLGRRIR